MKRNLSYITAFLLAVFFFVRCGEQTAPNKNMDMKNNGLNISDSGAKMVEVPIVLQQDSSQNLQLGDQEGLGLTTTLTAASSYSMSLTGCSSGLTGTVTSSSVRVYVGDTSCLLKLTSYVFNGNTYNPKAGSGFSTWLANDVATFVNASNSSDTYFVKVGSQITQAGVQSGDTVSYSFYNTTAGLSQSVGSATVSQAQTVSVSGQEAPNFVLSTNGSPVATGSVPPVVFNGVNSSGVGQFVFKLYCNVAMGVTGACGNTTSDPGAIALTAITYKLVGDTYGVSTGTALTVSQLATIMASGTSTINTGTDVLSDNNKGFKTSVLSGPGAINSNPNMILVLSDGTSYTYFSIQLASISNN